MFSIRCLPSPHYNNSEYDYLPNEIQKLWAGNMACNLANVGKGEYYSNLDEENHKPIEANSNIYDKEYV